MVGMAPKKQVSFSEHDDAETTNKMNSPLKVSSELGNKIKKLSPVTGAAESADAKVAFERLLKQASVSMFMDNEESGRENDTVKVIQARESPTTPTSRLESTAPDNSPRDVEAPVAAVPESSAGTKVKTAILYSTTSTTEPITPKVPSVVVVSKSAETRTATKAEAAQSYGSPSEKTGKTSPNLSKVSASPSSKEILSAHLSSIRPTENQAPSLPGDMEKMERRLSGHASPDEDDDSEEDERNATDERADLSAVTDDSEVFERELLRGNEKSLGELLSDIHKLKAEVEPHLHSKAEVGPHLHSKAENQERTAPKEYWEEGYHHYEEGTVASELHQTAQRPEQPHEQGLAHGGVQHAPTHTHTHTHTHTLKKHHHTDTHQAPGEHHSEEPPSRGQAPSHREAVAEGSGPQPGDKHQHHHYEEATLSTEAHVTAEKSKPPSDVSCHLPDSKDHARFVDDRKLYRDNTERQMAMAGDGSAHFYGHSHHPDHPFHHKIEPGHMHYETSTVSYELHTQGHGYFKSTVKPYEELGQHLMSSAHTGEGGDDAHWHATHHTHRQEMVYMYGMGANMPDDLVGINRASQLLQHYRDCLNAVESEFGRYLAGGSLVSDDEGDEDEEQIEDENGEKIGRRRVPPAPKAASTARSLELQTFSFDELEARVWKKHEELLQRKLVPLHSSPSQSYAQ